MLIVIAVPLCAQSDGNRGQIVGTVYDPVQAVVPNAKVQVQNKATGAVREFTTGPEGQFRAILLDAGSYDVKVDAQGFAQRVYQNVTVNVGSAVSFGCDAAAWWRRVGNQCCRHVFADRPSKSDHDDRHDLNRRFANQRTTFSGFRHADPDLGPAVYGAWRLREAQRISQSRVQKYRSAVAEVFPVGRRQTH